MPDEAPAKPKSKYTWYIVGAAAGVGLYFLYKYYTNQQAANSANTTLASEPSGAQSNSTDLAPAATASTINTYQDWEQQVQAWADSLGMDPATVANALNSYGNNTCLPSNEFSIIDKALGQFGLPPDAPFSGVVQCPTSTPAHTGGGSTTTTKKTTPTPAKSTSKVPANLANTLQSRLASLVGQLSSSTGKVSSPGQVAALKSSAVPAWLKPFGSIGQQFWEETINVGNISKQLPGGGGVNAAQATTLGQELAKADGYNWGSLNALQQQQYIELGNAHLLIAHNKK